MKTEHFYTLISLTIIILLFYLFYKIINPFLTPIIWAIVLSITFYPLYKLFLRVFKYPWIAALATLILILILIVGPATYIITILISEIAQTYSVIEEKGLVTLTKIQEHPLFLKLYQKLSPYILDDFDLRDTVVKGLKSLAAGIGEHISGFFKDVIAFVVGFIIMCLSIFYFLKDGAVFRSYIERLFPFSESQQVRLAKRIEDMVVAAI